MTNPTAGEQVHAPVVDPIQLSAMLGQKFPPTPQQAKVIAADLSPMLVVAGAGAGKTETMAARVVWLVANGYITPDQVLGLTFTRKAAQQLGQRIRHRLEQLAGIEQLRDLDPTGKLAHTLEAISPQVSTYDSFAGSLLREFGLLLPMEPSSRLITETELYQRAHQIVSTYSGELSVSNSVGDVVGKVLALSQEMDNHMVNPADIAEETFPFVSLFDELPKAPRQRDSLNKDMTNYRDTQLHRLQFLDLVRLLKEDLKDNHLITFGEQMSLAARLAEANPSVGQQLRRRFKVIMLDEYQDTSHAQRVLLSSLFKGQAVTAVGDPMQSIYGWRGATAANLESFVTDFAADDKPAPKMELTISFRNPAEVLDLANAVSATVLEKPGGGPRPVAPLSPRPGAGPGKVELGFFKTQEAELDFVADELAAEYALAKQEARPFTAAVLVRKNRQAQPIADALAARGIPFEIVGTAGLVDVPEIQDLIATATMLVRPWDSHAAMRMLFGPRVGLGINDVKALAERAANLAGRSNKKVEYSIDPLIKLEQIIAEQSTQEPETVVGLADALADLGEPERYSAEGYRRLQEFASVLRYLRTYGLSQSLPDLFTEIDNQLGLRTEVLTRQDPREDGAVGTTHLERFADVVAQFAAVPGNTLPMFLDYLALTRDHEGGLTPGEVQVRADRVQILTAHKAKGLEWGTVCVLNADASTYGGKAETWLTRVERVPSTLRGDAKHDAGLGNGAPVLNVEDVTNRKEFEEAIKAHIDDFRNDLAEESTRLFYVAMTRSEHRLMITAHALDGTIKGAEPYENFELLKQRQDILAPETVVSWYDRAEDADEAAAKAPVEAIFQSGWRPRGMAVVEEAMASLPELSQDKEIYTTWEKEVAALIEEYTAAQTPVVEVELSRELTATDMVALKANPEQFARRQRRPVPFKPNSYAKRGTAFHQWLEDRAGGQALLDVDELPGIDEELTDVDLEALKQAFLSSEWADRMPRFVEQPFEVSIDGIVLRGRMDAVFESSDGHWQIIDWKTGHRPTAAQMVATRLQLAVYRLAWSRLKGIDEQEIEAAFYYVMDGELIAPKDLPGEAELARLLRQAQAHGASDLSDGSGGKPIHISTQ
ncbi:UvrD-helicase domain-containing protein [Corynebacterium sp. SCR221107]|uniref:ATP-dependent helicase n=1 Tax=Corynebacterium sp. SCR221107 TaxID=3017361 RepID=UPI0022EC3D83|nr:UvrD-helicase domain-containing protein [Corynebacterium sp. SCR221107]WBT09380.1 UvrD-helicase domain-containing protein [Corynebacterium sp. SCR221107]